MMKAKYFLTSSLLIALFAWALRSLTVSDEPAAQIAHGKRQETNANKLGLAEITQPRKLNLKFLDNTALRVPIDKCQELDRLTFLESNDKHQRVSDKAWQLFMDGYDRQAIANALVEPMSWSFAFGWYRQVSLINLLKDHQTFISGTAAGKELIDHFDQALLSGQMADSIHEIEMQYGNYINDIFPSSDRERIFYQEPSPQDFINRLDDFNIPRSLLTYDDYGLMIGFYVSLIRNRNYDYAIALLNKYPELGVNASYFSLTPVNGTLIQIARETKEFYLSNTYKQLLSLLEVLNRPVVINKLDQILLEQGRLNEAAKSLAEKLVGYPIVHQDEIEIVVDESIQALLLDGIDSQLTAEQKKTLSLCKQKEQWFSDRELRYSDIDAIDNLTFINLVKQSPEYKQCQQSTEHKLNDEEITTIREIYAPIVKQAKQANGLLTLADIDFDAIKAKLAVDDGFTQTVFAATSYQSFQQLTKAPVVDIIEKLTQADILPNNKYFDVFVRFSMGDNLEQWLSYIDVAEIEDPYKLLNMLAKNGYVDIYKLVDQRLDIDWSQINSTDPLYQVIKNFSSLTTVDDGSHAYENYSELLKYLVDREMKLLPMHKRLLWKYRESSQGQHRYKKIIESIPEFALDEDVEYFEVKCE